MAEMVVQKCETRMFLTLSGALPDGMLKVPVSEQGK